MRLSHRVVACVLSVLAGAWIAHALRTAHPPRARAAAVAVETSSPVPVAAPPRSLSGPVSTDAVAEPEDRVRRALGEGLGNGKVITGATPHRLLLFTFDDGPDPRTTPRLLDALDALDVRAVFFVNTGRMQPISDRGRERAEIAREIAARGHLVGDHTVDHAILTRLPSASVRAQLEASREIFVEVFGARPWLFRPPGGAHDERIDALVAEAGYTQVLWNLGAPDHRLYDPRPLVSVFTSSLAQREASSRYGGGIVLLHDTHEWTVDAVPRMVEEVRRRNCALLEQDAELWDIVDDPAMFFAARGDAAPSEVAPPATLEPDVLAARQERLRAHARDYCRDPATPREDVMEVPPGALGSFFAALARVEDATPSSPALARIVHMGDSNVNRDQLPHYLRQALHRRFGDGGAGFVPIQPPTPEFTNRMVNYSVEGEWSACSILTRCDPYGHYGLGGVVARALPGSRTRIATRMSGPGRVASRIELWYGVEPGGGTLAVRVDRGPTRRITTDAPTVDDRWLSIDVAPGRHEVIVEGGTGSARAYGVVLESDGPGIVWDTLSMTGAFTKRVLEQDEAHFARQIHHRRPDLVIVQYGGNDLRRYLEGEVTAEGFEAEMRQLLARVRDARAEASCLLVGMGDHGKSGPMRVRPQHVEPLVEAQRRAAREAGCAFFDTYAAMGGRGSIHRWQRDGLASGDLVHLTAAGRRRMASTIHAALERGYDRHRAR